MLGKVLRSRTAVAIATATCGLLIASGCSSAKDSRSDARWAGDVTHLVDLVLDYKSVMGEATNLDEMGEACKTMVTKVQAEASQIGKAPDSEGDQLLDDLVQKTVETFQGCSTLNSSDDRESATAKIDSMETPQQQAKLAANRLRRYTEEHNLK